MMFILTFPGGPTIDMADVIDYLNGNRLQVALVFFVLLVGLADAYNALHQAFLNSNIATTEYVDQQIRAEDDKTNQALTEIRDKENVTNYNHAGEQASQAATNQTLTTQSARIETKVDTMSDKVDQMSERLATVEARINDMTPRQKTWKP